MEHLIPARQKCTNISQLTDALKGMTSEGGEGVILQLQDSPYEHGRSSKLIKLKASRQADTEALVVSVLGNDSLVLRLYALLLLYNILIVNQAK